MTDQSHKPANVKPITLANASALTNDELHAVSGGVRKSAGNQSSGVMFLAFTFKQVAV